MTDTQRYVNTASTTGGDGTTNGTAGSTRAYVSLNEAETALNGTIGAGDRVLIDCDGAGGTDGTETTFDGWTITDVDGLVVRGNRGVSTGFNDTTQAWSTSHYIITRTPSFGTLSVENSNILIDGIQIENKKNSASAISASCSRNARFINCRSSSNNGVCFFGSEFGTSMSAFEFSNCVAINGGKGFDLGTKRSDGVYKAYNNIALNCAVGFEVSTQSGATTGSVIDIHNNVAIDCTTEFTNLDSADVTVDATYNAGEGSAPTGHDSNWITLSATITDDITDTATTGDYTDTDLMPVASGNMDDTGLGESTDSDVPDVDLLDVARADPPDLGPFELVAAAGGGVKPPSGLSLLGIGA